MFTSSADKWNVLETKKRFYSPDLSTWIAYNELLPFGVNGILRGTLVLMHSDHGVVIDEAAAGPPVWRADGNKFVYPRCYVSLFNKKYQRLVVVDVIKQTVTVYKQKFTNLRLKKFENAIISGIDISERISIIGFNANSSEVKTKTKYRLISVKS